MHYPASATRAHPLTAILRAHILSVAAPQVRYILRGTRGAYRKHHVDPQEDALKVLAAPGLVQAPEFGREPADRWGSAQYVAPDGVSVSSEA